jgi:hypothetical protein
MTARPAEHVKVGFEKATQTLRLELLQPLRTVPTSVKNSVKYTQIVASIREIGIIEPPVVAHDRSTPGKFLLLDGHLRIEVLRDLGIPEVVCLISTDDEAFTYNKRVSRLAIIQEHKMILKAIERGVSEAKIAKALHIEINTLRQKKNLLVGICPEAAELLEDKHIHMAAFSVLRKMAPLRQLECAELMVGMNKYTMSYATALLAATPESQLIDKRKPRIVRALAPEQAALMERESANLDREFKMVEQSYGADHLDLVLARGYLGKLLVNASIASYLAKAHPEIFGEFKKLATSASA